MTNTKRNKIVNKIAKTTATATKDTTETTKLSIAQAQIKMLQIQTICLLNGINFVLNVFNFTGNGIAEVDYDLSFFNKDNFDTITALLPEATAIIRDTPDGGKKISFYQIMISGKDVK